MKDQLNTVLDKFLINNKVRVNSEDFKLQLLSNPSYPSIKSISDTLDYFRIDNIVANVPKDALDQLPQFFLAVLESGQSTTIAQVQQKRDILILVRDDGTKQKLSIDSFKEIWNGTIIAIETGSLERKGPLSLYKDPLPLLLILISIALGYKMFGYEWPVILYTLLGCMGLIISYYVIQESFGLHNEITSKICNSVTSKASCNDVINSRSSTLFSFISLSDASITFFTSTLFIVSFLGYHPTFFFGISIIGIPIVLYSIFAQILIIKKWCPLCLGVVLVLITQLVVTFLAFNTPEFDLVFFIKGGVTFGVCYLSWIMFKSLLTKALRQKQVETEFLRFKRNEDLFNSLLTKKELSGKSNFSSLTFGNPDAKLEVTGVTNPLCGFCTKAFEAYDTLLKTHGDKFKLNIVFNVPSNSLEHPSSQIAQRIIELYQHNKKEAYTVLGDWFRNRDLEVWQRLYGTPVRVSPLVVLQKHTTWCESNEITYTPATLIGNYFFPKEYEVKDLSLFIDYLIEEKNNTTEIKEKNLA